MCHGGGFGHESDQCTFETLCRTFDVNDRKVLQQRQEPHPFGLLRNPTRPHGLCRSEDPSRLLPTGERRRPTTATDHASGGSCEAVRNMQQPIPTLVKQSTAAQCFRALCLSTGWGKDLSGMRGRAHLRRARETLLGREGTCASTRTRLVPGRRSFAVSYRRLSRHPASLSGERSCFAECRSEPERECRERLPLRRWATQNLHG